MYKILARHSLEKLLGTGEVVLSPVKNGMPHKHPGSGNLIWKGLRILPSKVLGMWGKNAQGSLID